MKQMKVFLAVFTIFVSTLVFTSPALAIGNIIAISTTAYSPGVASNVGISLTGFDQTQNYQVTVKFVNTDTNADVSNGTLAATQGSTSLISGYSSYSAAKLGFKGTYSAIAGALSTITWNPATASGNISIRIGIATAPGNNEFYDANSGHYYKFIPSGSGASWGAARTAAEASTLYGLRGYLAEINSSAENSFIGTETSATNVWIGATDQAVEGTWIWDGATSTPKPTGSGNDAGRSADFHSWASGEPNDHVSGGPSGEDCAVTNWQGAVGMWNDLPCASAYAYLIEYGGRPGESSTASTATLTTTVRSVVPTVISVAQIGGVTPPVVGATPVSTVTAANGYTGTVTWSPTPVDSKFIASTVYTASITLTAASSYTLTGVSANFFTVAGATSVTHSANSGVITAVFPATDTTISVAPIGGVTVPVVVATPVSTVTAANGYTGTVSWSPIPVDSKFAGLTAYTATITLTASSGYTLTGVPANFFSVAGATTVTHLANSGVITAVFAATEVAPPVFTIAPNVLSPTQGTAITSYGISSTGGAIASYSISPAITNTPGLTFSTSTGLISGIPTTIASARTYTITGTNATASTSRTFEITINSPPPPSVLKTISAPKISRDLVNIMCSTGTFIFIRNGYTEEPSKITSQKYFLLQDGKTVDFLESALTQVKFENKSSYLNSTLSCLVEVGQESLQSSVSSLDSKLLAQANESKRAELMRVETRYYADRDAAYSKKDKEFARIAEVKAAEIAAGKTSTAILLASAKYQKAFTAASDLWKREIEKATTDRDAGRKLAQANFIDLLEKSGVSINPRAAAPSVTSTPKATPTPSPTPSPTPTATTNPQPSTEMVKVGTVYMASNSYFLNDEAKRNLNALSVTINASGAKSILVYGHTDNRGGVNNTLLSQNRAKAVANYLRPLVTIKKISVGWYSSSKPAQSGTSAADKALNRRVEIYTK